MLERARKGLLRSSKPGDLALADALIERISKFGDISPISVETTAEIKPPSQEFLPFSDTEMQILGEEGAFFINLTGETIEDERKAGRLFRHIVDGGDRLLKEPSIIAQVAIFPDPEKFFVPNTARKALSTQEKLTKKDAEELRQRTGLRNIDEIIPDQASTLTELTFKYFDETTEEGNGVWLFGQDYGNRYGITKNPVDKSSFNVAAVGYAHPTLGLIVDSWPIGGGFGRLRVVRLVVKKKK